MRAATCMSNPGGAVSVYSSELYTWHADDVVLTSFGIMDSFDERAARCLDIDDLVVQKPLAMNVIKIRMAGAGLVVETWIEACQFS